MKIDIDELNSVQRKVRVELPVETVASEFSRAYKNLGQRVRVKGFRTGKIPRSVLQGIYGDEVKGEVRSHLVEESLGRDHPGTRIADRLASRGRSQRPQRERGIFLLGNF